MMRADRGSGSLETVVLVPVLVLGFLFVVWTGRAGQTVSKLEHAADRGARAAALVSRARMAGVGSAAALAELQANGADCVNPAASVSVATDRVTVTVHCTVSTQGLSGLPATRASASSSEPIDRYRAD